MRLLERFCDRAPMWLLAVVVLGPVEAYLVMLGLHFAGVIR